MTEARDVLLDRAQLERAFTALGERLVRRGVVADVHGVVLEEARHVAQDLGLPAWWLNEQELFC